MRLPGLARRLVAMAARDQRMRRRVLRGAAWDPTLDRKHTSVLAGIVARYGWPTVSMAGKRGSEAAWLLAQHADRSRKKQRDFLEAMRAAHGANERAVPMRHLAYLTDRVRLNAGKPQLYGTQFAWDGSAFVPRPIERRQSLAARRRAAGLVTLAEDQRRMERWYGPMARKKQSRR